MIYICQRCGALIGPNDQHVLGLPFCDCGAHAWTPETSEERQRRFIAERIRIDALLELEKNELISRQQDDAAFIEWLVGAIGVSTHRASDAWEAAVAHYQVEETRKVLLECRSALVPVDDVGMVADITLIPRIDALLTEPGLKPKKV